MPQFPYSMCDAARWGDLAAIRQMIAAGESINGDSYESPFACAVRSPHADVGTLKALLELGADVKRALHPSDAKKARFLLQADADPVWLFSPELDFASLHLVVEAIDFSDGRKIWNVDSPLERTLIRHGVKGVRLLFERGAKLDAYGWGELHAATVLGSVEGVQRALAQGERPQHPFVREWGWKQSPDPWSLALCVGDLEKLETMRQAGADPLHLDGEDRTGLFVAAEANKPEVVRWLVDLGVPVDWPWKPGFEETAFEIACERGAVDAAEALIELGALEAIPKENRQLLFLRPTNIGVVRMLLRHGLELTDWNLDALLTIAVERSDDEYARGLIAMTQYRNAPGDEGFAMSAAVRADERNIVEMMLAAHWNPNAIYDDVTALYRACSPQVEQMLIRAGGKIRWNWG